MGLFSRKKKELPERNLPEFPRFPEMPSYMESRTSTAPAPSESPMPAYEPEFKDREEVRERRPEPMARPQETQPVQQREQATPNWNAYQRRVDIPVRTEPSYMRPEFKVEENPYRVANPPPITRFEPDVWKPSRQDAQQTKQWPEERPMQRPEQTPMQNQNVQEKPVFVKIEQYREAMASIEVLKQKLREVESIIEKLGQIRSQEQIEINNCQDNINKIKEKLIDIDKKLFEV